MIRKPVVSGQFYPKEAAKLRAMVKGFLPEKTAAKIDGRGLILPHAGYQYSGKVAAVTVNSVYLRKNVVVLGTNHTGQGSAFSLWAQGAWQTPLGDIPVNETLSRAIIDGGNYIKEDRAAHAFEHSIEVELPILKAAGGEFSLIPIACQHASGADYLGAARQLCDALGPVAAETTFVASTDMTHYEPEPAARRKDSLAIEHILNFDVEGLIKTVKKENISMCGLAPVCVFLHCMKLLGARKARVVLYETSGSASGDFDSVVGYAGIVVQ